MSRVLITVQGGCLEAFVASARRMRRGGQNGVWNEVSVCSYSVFRSSDEDDAVLRES
jgi:hypothetical protein